MGVRPNFSTNTLRTVDEKKAGIEGPMYIFFIPKARRVSNMQTAFCSYHESTRVRGRSLTPQSNAFARARAT